MKKRLISMLLVLLLFVQVLSGCGQQAAEEAGTMPTDMTAVTENNSLTGEPDEIEETITDDYYEMSDAEWATLSLEERLMGYWVLDAYDGGTGEFMNMRIDPDGYVVVDHGGMLAEGQWWYEFTVAPRIRMCIYSGSNRDKDQYIYEFRSGPKQLELYYVDNSNTASSVAYTYTRGENDYQKYMAPAGAENLEDEGLLRIYLHGRWVCNDPYMDTRHFPSLLVFSPTYNREYNTTEFIYTNVDGGWQFTWFDPGKMHMKNGSSEYSYDFRLEGNTLYLTRYYFTGDFNNPGVAEAMFKRVDMFANVKQNW